LFSNNASYYGIVGSGQYASFFNFCLYTTNPCNNTEGEAYAYQQYLDGSYRCSLLSNSAYEPSKVDTISSTTNTTENRHIRFTQSGGQCGNGSSSITFEITCNPAIKTTPNSFSADFNLNDTDSCNPIVTFAHSAGCPVASMNSFAAFLQENPWIFAIFLVFFGAFCTLWGRKFIPWIVAIVGGIVTFIVVMFFASVVGMLNYVDPTKTGGSLGLVILAFVLAIGLGVLVGWVLKKKFFLIGFALIGFAAGFLVGNLLYNLVLFKIDSTVLYWIVCIVLGGVAAFFCVKQKHELAILTTALLGSYAFVRGISVFLGGYPSEATFYEQLKAGTAQFTWQFILYLVSMGLVFIGGVWF